MSDHPSHRIVVAYVTGTLHDAAARSFERHVSLCPACGKRLQREASLETALYQAAETGRSQAARLPRSEKLARVAAAALALAAALLLVVGEPPQWISFDSGSSQDPAVASSTAGASLGDDDFLACLPQSLEGEACEEPSDLLVVAQSLPDDLGRVDLFSDSANFTPDLCVADDDGERLVCAASYPPTG